MTARDAGTNIKNRLRKKAEVNSGLWQISNNKNFFFTSPFQTGNCCSNIYFCRILRQSAIGSAGKFKDLNFKPKLPNFLGARSYFSPQ
jgi:hypothetical protein